MKRGSLVLILLFGILAGCAADDGSGPKITPYCGGVDGVEMKFVEGSPPTEVFDQNYPFDITLRLFNKGEDTIDIQNSKIELSGISNVDFGGPSYMKFVPEKVAGKHKDQNGNCAEGDPVLVSFGGSGEEPFKYRHSLPGNTQFTLRADLCYKYKTKSTVQFCVQKDLPRFGQEPTCKVDEVKKVSNSGSPVHIENFRQSPGGESKIAFSFEIVHKGTGAIHSGQLCDSSFTARNKVRVKVASRVGSISCTSLNGAAEGEVTIAENKRVINCLLGTSGVSGREFETPLDIEVGFNYKQHEDMTLLVKHLG